MNEELVTKLVTMAETLGTTVEYLWSVLIKQAFISGILHSFHILMWLTIMACVGFVVYQKTCVEKDKRGDFILTGEIAFMAWVGYIVLCLLAGVMIASSLSPMVTAWINPEYWALKQILR